MTICLAVSTVAAPVQISPCPDVETAIALCGPFLSYWYFSCSRRSFAAFESEEIGTRGWSGFGFGGGGSDTSEGEDEGPGGGLYWTVF